MEARKLDDGAMSYRLLPAERPPIAVVLFTHGFAESARRHAPTLASLAAMGIAAYAYDLSGHGGSPGARGFVRRFDDLLVSSTLARARIAAELPGLPLFLIGYSLGGLVALRGGQREPQGLAGVVLIATGFEIAGDLPALVRHFGTVVGDLMPHLPVARLRLQHLRPDERSATGLLEVLLPRDPLIPARTAGESIRASAAAAAGANAWRVPTLVVHGDHDRIAALESARRFVARATNAEIELDVIAGGHHDLLRGRDGERVRADITAWILAHAR